MHQCPRSLRRPALCLLIGLAAAAVAADPPDPSDPARASTPVRAEFVRFQPADSPRVSAWRKTLAAMPSCWRAARAVVVREVDRSTMADITRDLDPPDTRGSAIASSIDGFYKNAGSRVAVVISLSDSLKGEAAQFVFAHEYAHYVWDELLSVEDRREFRTLWHRQCSDGRLVSRYAEESADEGFAEAVSHFVVRPARLRARDPAAFDYLEARARRAAEADRRLTEWDPDRYNRDVRE